MYSVIVSVTAQTDSQLLSAPMPLVYVMFLI